MGKNHDAVRTDNPRLLTIAEHAADCLWRLALWSDDRHRDFSERTGRSPVSAFGQAMEGWPITPVPRELLVEVYVLCKLVEERWGRTIDSVANEMGGRYDAGSVAYYVLMSAIGHGVGLDDDNTAPEGLDTRPIRNISDPCERYVPDPTDWSGFPDDTVGSEDDDGPEPDYNLGNPYQSDDSED